MSDSDSSSVSVDEDSGRIPATSDRGRERSRSRDRSRKKNGKGRRWSSSPSRSRSPRRRKKKQSRTPDRPRRDSPTYSPYRPPKSPKPVRRKKSGIWADSDDDVPPPSSDSEEEVIEESASESEAESPVRKKKVKRKEESDSDKSSKKKSKKKKSKKKKKKKEKKKKKKKKVDSSSEEEIQQEAEVEAKRVNEAVAKEEVEVSSEEEPKEEPIPVALETGDTWEQDNHVVAEESDSDDFIGPAAPVEERNVQAEHKYGGALMPGEGQAIASYVMNGQRIPRRGEVGLTSKEISQYEDLGYVMSGSRHKRMNAIRIRKENQVYSVEEKRALSLLNFEEKAAREKKLMSDFRSFLQQKGGEQK
uniref:NF-kappa-B-activating protein C-terminal domain-containing protein n=1 Tax=Norrisiella sphaerica TaxID=552664 RepID=A0A7S2QTG3_9EUKA|mmetsp:Transcript_372/g.540  ORF Transcript_372/g.540 Transcript_372/m.540 type:complete len:361 (+) Transcript_372:66-1148(+)